MPFINVQSWKFRPGCLKLNGVLMQLIKRTFGTVQMLGMEHTIGMGQIIGMSGMEHIA